MTTTPLDSILSGRGESTPEAQETKETETTQTTASDAGAHENALTPGTGGEPEAKTEEAGDGKMVPVGALQAERQKAKRYTEQIADFEKKIGESNAAWERRFNALLERLAPQQRQEPEQPVDFFSNPEVSTRNIASEIVTPQMRVIQDQLYANARIIAESVAGEDRVKEAQTAFDMAVASRTLDPADYQRVMSSANPFMAAVKWHKRNTALAEIGDDPDKFREKVKAEVLAELQSNGHTVTNGANGAAPAMPSNLAAVRNVGSRSGPAWAGPKTLDDIFKR